jgi:hypothetical protein
MILFNKLVRADLMLAIAVILSLALGNDTWRGVFKGMAFATIIISISNHIEYYKQTRRFY